MLLFVVERSLHLFDVSHIPERNSSHLQAGDGDISVLLNTKIQKTLSAAFLKTFVINVASCFCSTLLLLKKFFLVQLKQCNKMCSISSFAGEI